MRWKRRSAAPSVEPLLDLRAGNRPAGTNSTKQPSMVDCGSELVAAVPQLTSYYIDKLNEFVCFLAKVCLTYVRSL